MKVHRATHCFTPPPPQPLFFVNATFFHICMWLYVSLYMPCDPFQETNTHLASKIAPDNINNSNHDSNEGSDIVCVLLLNVHLTYLLKAIQTGLCNPLRVIKIA